MTKIDDEGDRSGITTLVCVVRTTPARAVDSQIDNYME